MIQVESNSFPFTIKLINPAGNVIELGDRLVISGSNTSVHPDRTNRIALYAFSANLESDELISRISLIIFNCSNETLRDLDSNRIGLNGSLWNDGNDLSSNIC